MRSKLHLPGAEALHAAHVLTEIIKGVLSGAASDKWGEDCIKVVLNYFCRIEFQDGKRKRRQGHVQDYHGRGSPRSSMAKMSSD